MSQREFMIVLAHTSNCGMCRARMLGDAASVFGGRSLTEGEREILSGLKFEDFLTPEILSRAARVPREELEHFSAEPVVRLRHL
jgi:hypothetical protein